ncbi:MAG: HAD-IA family hydrolase [Chloroflexota bacterium]|nr:HAD-IA family hydrolase [Chloroflexota bacterium]
MVFDLDGTLVNTVETRIEAWLQVFQEVRIKAEREHVARLIGSDGKRLAHEVADVAGHPISDDKAEAIDKRCGQIYDGLNTDPQPTSGAHDLLVALTASDLPWAVATSSRAEQVGTSVDALQLSQKPRIIDGSHVEHAKPAPDLLLLAAQQLDLPASACWYIGDSTWDMQAATAARMVAVAVAYGAVSGETLVRAGANVVTSLPELQADLQRRGLLR